MLQIRVASRSFFWHSEYFSSLQCLQVANASFRTHNSIQGKDSSKLITSDAANITDARSKGGGSGDVDTSKSESSDELFAKPAQEQVSRPSDKVILLKTTKTCVPMQYNFS